MTLTRKSLMVDAEQLAELASRRGVSESEAVRALIESALFEDDFADAMEQLRAAGFGFVDMGRPEEAEKTPVEARPA